MQVLEIPVTPTPQTFRVALNNTVYTWRIYWLVPFQCWVLDIADLYENPLVNGIPLITGADLLAQFPNLVPGGLYVISDQMPPEIVPDYDHLGITGHIYYVPLAPPAESA